MCDTVVVLSSGDESEPEKVVKEICKKEPESKRRIELPCEPSKKRRIEATCIGSVRNDLKKKCESNGSVTPDKENHEVVFDEFIEICLELDNSANMRKIIEKKLKKYYLLLVPEYRKSEQLTEFLQRKGAEIQRSASHRFMHLKEVVDELDAHRSDKIDLSSAPNVSDRFVRKLCKALELLHRKIKKLEEKDVDWEDDGESSYMQLQRYRERLVKVHAKLQELEGHTSSTFERQISFSGTQFPKVNRAIEKYVNVKKEFPDFNDIYDLLKKSYENENIVISAQELNCEAKKVFRDIGGQLQKLRRNEFWEAHQHYLVEEDDPADTDEGLRSTLDENKKKFQESIDEIINSYANKAKKPQFASEDSNSSEGALKKELKSEGSHEEEEDNEDDEDDDDEEENENVGETMDDILSDIGKEEPEDSLDSTENVFLYCGPVSPPTPAGEDTNSDVLSQTSSPASAINVKEDEEAEVSAEISIIEETSEVYSLPGCSKWDNSDKQVNKSSSEKNVESHKTVKQEPGLTENCKTFIKVRPLSSLQRKVPLAVPEEILLD